MWKIAFEILMKSRHFENPEWEKMDCALSHFLSVQKERMSSLTKHFLPTVLVLSVKNGFLKIKNSIFQSKYTRYGKNFKKQNCVFKIDRQIYFRSIFDRTRFFLFNSKKRYDKWKIPSCSKSMWDTKKMLENEIVHVLYNSTVSNFESKVSSDWNRWNNFKKKRFFQKNK